MISKLQISLKPMNCFQFVTLKCLEILIYTKDNYEDEDIIEELDALEEHIKIINETEFEDTMVLINFMNKISNQIHELSLKISVLLHTLTFKIKGKYIPVKKNQIFEYVTKKFKNNSEFINVASGINIKRNKTLLANLYNYFTGSLIFSSDTISSSITQYLIKVKSKETTIHESHSDWVGSVEHIPNTKYMISGSEDNTIKIWNY